MGKRWEINIRWIKESLSLFLLSALVGLSACNKAENLYPALDSNPITDENSASIIGGQPVTSADIAAASTVGLYDVNWGKIICTGSIIADNMIVTAAHCLDDGIDGLLVVFTQKVPQTNADLNRAPFRRTVSYKINELYDSRSRSVTDLNDIALIKIDGIVPRPFRPVSLLESIQSLTTGMPVLLVGFGLTDAAHRIDTNILRKVSVPLASSTIGRSEIAFDQGTIPKGACMGDSGGPALITQNGKTVLIGVTSRGVGTNSHICRSVTIYTSVAAHLNWIRQTSNLLNQIH